MQFRAVVLALVAAAAFAFGPAAPLRTAVARSSAMTMEYIPDGLTKEQWAEEKKKLGPESGLGVGGTGGMKFIEPVQEPVVRGVPDPARAGQGVGLRYAHVQRQGEAPEGRDQGVGQRRLP